MKKALIFLVALLAMFTANAAIGDYQFTSTAGTYTEITGGTLTAVTDDDDGEDLTLPFTFTYCGVAYTTARVSANGWLEMGQAYTDDGYTNTWASTTIKPIIAPLWDDLHGAGAAIRYETTGDAPNRVFTMQWKDVKWQGSTGTLQNFQVKLYETSNKFEIVYGAMLTPANSASASIGFNDATGGAGHFVSVTPAASPTVSSTVANNSINAATFLTNGLTYTFSIPPVVANDLAVMDLTTAPATVYAGDQLTIATIIKNKGPADQTNKDILFKVDGNVVSTQNIASLAAGASDTLTYNWTVTAGVHTVRAEVPADENTANDFAQKSVEGVVPVTVYPYTQGFEDATFPPAGWSTNVWTRVPRGTGWAAKSAYSPAGSHILTSIKLNLPANHRLKYSWKNNDSAKGNRVVGYDTTFCEISTNNGVNWTGLDTLSSAGSQSTYENVELNLNAFAGNGVMVRWRHNTAGSASAYGSILDDVVIEEIPVTPIFTVTPATKAFGDVNQNTTSAYQLFTVKNIGGGTLNISAAALAGTNSNQFAVLDSNTYPMALTTGQTMRIRAAFAPTVLGNAVASLNITADAKLYHEIALTGNGIQPPFYSDSFETYTDFSTDFSPWTVADLDTHKTYGIENVTFPNAYSRMAFIVFNPSATTPAVTNQPAHSGNKYAACFNAVPKAGSPFQYNNDWLISRKMTLDGGNVVKFWAKSATVEWGAERFNVLVSTTDNNPASFTCISGATYQTVQAVWTQFSYDLSTYANQTVYIAIQCVSEDAFYFMVDDFEVFGGGSDIENGNTVTRNTLSQNYPNPFNPETAINFSLANSSTVKLAVYNAKGEFVKELISGVQTAGNHSVKFNALGMNSGVYFYKLTTPESSMTKKMLLVK